MRTATSAFRALLALALLLLAAPASAQALVGGSLQDALAGASATDQLEVIVTFEGSGPLDASQLGLLTGTGVVGYAFQSLPIAGVLATPVQVAAIAALPGVRSVWFNEELQYENDRSTDITGVDRLRADASLRTASGMPFTGRGVSVLVNDSGVDGTHPDLQFGATTVQNVAAQTNLHSLSTLLPVTYTEDVPNTDIAGGHGTHVAGIIAGSGAMSDGIYEGVAPGANIVGYGSGAGLFILDTIGGFDYALTHQAEYNIRVVSNSFGSTGDIGTDFDPDHPTNVATKALADRGVIVVFSAGNSGAGENTITGNFKKAPWVVLVAAGDAFGSLASFSSRGRSGHGGTVVVDGETFEWVDRPTITAPGVDVISVRATTGDGEPADIEPQYAPFYTSLSGTSMSCPHVSGIVALMLEADPTLDVYDVRRLLQETATNMPGREGWESGAGYANAYAAVQGALGRGRFGRTVNLLGTFNANALLADGGAQNFSIFFSPVGEREVHTFEVAPDVSIVKARAVVPENTIAIVLEDPNGTRYGSGITLPILGEVAGVSAPGVPGTWSIYVSGIGGVSGQDVDPLGVTNGYAVPGTINARVEFVVTSGFSGLSDVDGHEHQPFIETAVTRRLLDGFGDGSFRPDAVLRRRHLAQYLVMGAGVRQFLPTDGGRSFSDVNNASAPYVEAVTAAGAALKDRAHTGAGLMRTADGQFDPRRAVSRGELAYSLVQAFGFGAFAEGYTGDVFVSVDGERLRLADSDQIPADLRGYVQLAIDTGVMAPIFLTNGTRTSARFRAARLVRRGVYAAAATRFLEVYPGADPANVPTGDNGGTAPAMAASSLKDAPGSFTLALDQNYPNPFTGSSQITFTLAEAGPARVTLYDQLGRAVRVLLSESDLPAGPHSVELDADGLASGTYVYRLEAGGQALVRRLAVAR